MDESRTPLSLLILSVSNRVFEASNRYGRSSATFVGELLSQSTLISDEVRRLLLSLRLAANAECPTSRFIARSLSATRARKIRAFTALCVTPRAQPISRRVSPSTLRSWHAVRRDGRNFCINCIRCALDSDLRNASSAIGLPSAKQSSNE